MPAVFPIRSFPVKIRIVNPTPGGARFTSASRAEAYVRDGRARLSACGTLLRFITNHHSHRSAELTAQELEDQAWRFTSRGYDGTGRVLGEREIKRIPVVLAYKLLQL